MCLKITVLVLCLSSILFIFPSNGLPKKWPSNFPRCYRDDPSLNKCLLEATKKMKPFLKAGIPELNVPPISPFLVPEVVVQQGSGPMSYKIVLKNLTIVGFDTYEFDYFNFDVKKLHFDALVKLGVVTMFSDYSLSGKLLAVPIEGEGRMQTTISSSNGTLHQSGKLITKKGLKYLKLEDPIIKIDVGDIKEYKFDGLFGGNEVLAQAADQIFRDNQRELIEELKPTVEKIVASIVADILNKSTVKVPFDELYPEHR